MWIVVGKQFEVVFDQVIEQIIFFEDIDWIKYIKICFDLLSEFWGCDMYLGVYVLLLKGWVDYLEIKYLFVIMYGYFFVDFGGWCIELVDIIEFCVYSLCF